MTCGRQLAPFRRVVRFENADLYSALTAGTQTGVLEEIREIFPPGWSGYVSHFRTIAEPSDTMIASTTAGVQPFLFEGAPGLAQGRGRVASDAAGSTTPTTDGATDYTTKDLGQDARHFGDGLQGLLTGAYSITAAKKLSVTMVVSGMAMPPCECGG